jgi:hypothetical protein
MFKLQKHSGLFPSHTGRAIGSSRHVPMTAVNRRRGQKWVGAFRAFEER